jgi:hypothetical protein
MGGEWAAEVCVYGKVKCLKKDLGVPMVFEVSGKASEQ